jgi:hypothetical protein
MKDKMETKFLLLKEKDTSVLKAIDNLSHMVEVYKRKTEDHVHKMNKET